VNSKVVLYFAVAALIGIAFYVVRARERRRHPSPTVITTDPAPRARPAGSTPRPSSS
jgi:hypothetical protein